MATVRLSYVAPWWTYWLHNFPHVNFSLQSVGNTFKPEEASYQQVGNFGNFGVKAHGFFIPLKESYKRSIVVVYN